jgi:hypothetical protein
MRQHALWMSPLVLAACYFSPDKHRESDDFDVAEAGAHASDASTVVGLDGSLDSSLDAAEAGCASDLECPLAAPQCRNGACLPCSEQNDCARFADTPNCGPAGTCVVCTAERMQLCTGATPACDPMTNACVQCVADTDCPSETQAACGATRSCGACTEDADCTRFGKVCDTRAGACVQCRPQTEATDCQTGTACDPKLLTCTSRQRGSVTTCNSCVADSECTTDHRCIAMTYGAEKQDLGGLCLKRAVASCAKPYSTVIRRASATGVAAEDYCGINELNTTCAAVLLFNAGQTCTSDESCGVRGSVCETVKPIPNACTYKCTTGFECYDGFACGGAAGSLHCGG